MVDSCPTPDFKSISLQLTSGVCPLADSGQSSSISCSSAILPGRHHTSQPPAGFLDSTACKPQLSALQTPPGTMLPFDSS